MSDKFKTNFPIVFPAALATLLLYCLLGEGVDFIPSIDGDTSWWLTLPYMVVIVTAVLGVNVMLVLIGGILTAVIQSWFLGIEVLQSCRIIGNGISSMGELIIITLLAAGMLGVVKHNGGIEYLLKVLTSHLRRRASAKWCIGAMVGVVNLCTANNTIAILTVGDIARKISSRFSIAPQTTASLLDTCSCIVQCMIPYGAQCLLAAGLAGVTPGALIPYLYYPMVLTLMVAIAITFNLPRIKNPSTHATNP